ncbi:MAG TPA: hypothetical protein VFV87_21560, partial [Pirellulaceae bacterium]|nr:hypothetical protein [Pirellulaceae bacterium]
MDLFSISCTTCKSRLKVREESAIGQILACPKCGGMVMVNAPEGWQKGAPLPEARPSATPSITTVVEVRRPDETLGDSNFEAIDDLLSDAPPKMKPSSVSVAPDAPGLARPRFVGAPPPVASAASATPAAPLVGEGSAIRKANEAAPSPAAESIAEGPKPPPPGEANAIEPPPPDWSPPQPWRWWAMMVGSVAAGIVMALAVVVGMIRFFRDDPQTIAQAGSNPPVAGPITPTVSGGNPAATPATSNPSAPVTPETTASAEDTKPPAALPAPMPEEQPMPPVPMPGAEEGDPLGLARPPKPPDGGANLNDPLAKFDRLIGAEGDPLPMPMETEEPAAATPDPPTADDKPVLPRPAPREVDVAARLADPLPGIETSGTPLADFLQIISDLSTIPITLEPDGLPLVRRTVESPVVLTADEGRNTTVGRALATGLARHGLEYVASDDQLLVRLVEPEKLPLLGYPVKDLAADEQQMADLGEMLQALIEPDSWEASGGEGALAVDATSGKLNISQRRAVHAQLLIAFEKLRTARKLPLQSTGYDPGLFQLATRSARAKARLETPITLNFSQPTPLVRIVDYLGKAGGVRILIDWRDIAGAGWNPDGEATLLADKQPLSAALDALLDPMDLTWRIVDGRTIQVLTPETHGSRVELEFYSASGLLAADATGGALLAKVRAALGEGHFRETGGPGELHYDAPSQCLLAALPQPQQRE